MIALYDITEGIFLKCGASTHENFSISGNFRQDRDAYSRFKRLVKGTLHHMGPLMLHRDDARRVANPIMS